MIYIYVCVCVCVCVCMCMCVCVLKFTYTRSTAKDKVFKNFVLLNVYYLETKALWTSFGGSWNTLAYF
jgi:hypothetical protein